MAYVDVGIQENKLIGYYTQFINKFDISVDIGYLEDSCLNEFLRKVIEESTLNEITLYEQIMISELKLSTFILLTYTSKNTSKVKASFIKRGIIQTLTVFMSVFTASFYKFTGLQYVALYEIICFKLKFSL